MSIIHVGVENSSGDITGNRPVSPSSPLPTVSAALVKLGYQQITSLSPAAALTVPTGATFCIVTAESQAVRWRDDGTNPTASVGMPIASGGSYTFNGAVNLAALRFIEQTASAILNVSYYR
jgi:hypothetical protein